MIQTNYHEAANLWKKLLLTGLEEDAWQWDWTTLGTLGDRVGEKIRAQVIAKSPGVWAGSALAQVLPQVAKEISLSELEVDLRVKDGASLKPGQKVVLLEGPARVLLALERPFLNLAAYASGIATQTKRLSEIVKKKCPKDTPRVSATRKVLPAFRDLAIHSVRAGGGFSHRVNLAGGVLIKENHIAAAGGIAKAIHGAKQAAPHGLKIEVEVRDLVELAKALEANADGVLLDNFTPKQVKSALKLIRSSKHRLIVEVSGGINEKNIGSYAIPGVDVLSVGSITHSVTAIDLSLLVL